MALTACRSAPPPQPPGASPTLATQAAPPPSPCEALSTCAARAEALAEEDPRAAEALADACAACASAPVSVHLLLTSLRSERGALIEARDAALRGSSARSESALLWQALARAERALERWPEAIRAYAAARRLRPDDAALAEEERHLLARQGTEAQRLEAVLEPILLEAEARVALEDRRGAKAALDRALGLAEPVPPLAARVLLRRAVLALLEARLPEAELDLAAASAAAPPRSALAVEVAVAQSELLLALGRPEAAELAARGALAVEPENPLAHTNLALALAKRGMIEPALAALEAAIAAGLARRLGRVELLAIPGIERLRAHPRFDRLLEQAWAGQ